VFHEDYSNIEKLLKKPEIISTDPVVVFVHDRDFTLRFADRLSFLETLRYLTRKRVELFADCEDRPRVQAPPKFRT
jgi:hypothetical protein